jgi:hypothetical protein
MVRHQERGGTHQESLSGREGTLRLEEEGPPGVASSEHRSILC